MAATSCALQQIAGHWTPQDPPPQISVSCALHQIAGHWTQSEQFKNLQTVAHSPQIAGHWTLLALQPRAEYFRLLLDR